MIPPIYKVYLPDRDAIRFVYGNEHTYAYKEIDSIDVLWSKPGQLPEAFHRAAWVMRLGDRIRLPSNWNVYYGGWPGYAA